MAIKERYIAQIQKNKIQKSDIFSKGVIGLSTFFPESKTDKILGRRSYVFTSLPII